MHNISRRSTTIAVTVCVIVTLCLFVAASTTSSPAYAALAAQHITSQTNHDTATNIVSSK